MDKNIMVKNKIEAVKVVPTTKAKIIKKIPIAPFKSEGKKLIPEKDTIILNKFMYLYFKNKINPTTYNDLIK
jgi:hypothetical protein